MPVILSGGLFKARGSLLPEAVAMHVHLRAPRARVIPARREPVVGALAYAREKLGLAVDAPFLDAAQHGLSAINDEEAV
jgi:hypothetical protein